MILAAIRCIPVRLAARLTAVLMAAALGLGGSADAGAGTLDTVKARGSLTCGVSQGLPG